MPAGETRGRRSGWSLAIALPLAAVLLCLALRGVDWQEMLGTLRGARPQYLALGCALGSTAYLLRSLRWRVLLSAERWIPAPTVFWATAAGYLGNNLLPARAGELIRSVALGRKAGVSAAFVLATAVTERILDALALVLIGTLALAVLGGLPAALVAGMQVMAGLAALGLAGVLVAPALQDHLKWALSRLPLSARWKERLAGLLDKFLLGMRALQHPGRAASFTGFTAAIWLTDALGTMIGVRALSLALGLPQALVLLAALGLSSAMPSTPGYIGVYQLVAVAVLVPFGFSKAQAVVCITVLQAAGYVTILLWGLVGLWRLGRTPG